MNYHAMAFKKWVNWLQGDLHVEDVLGRTCLHHGAQSGSVETLQYIISQDSDVIRTTAATTPLHYAAKVYIIVMYFVILFIGGTGTCN